MRLSEIARQLEMDRQLLAFHVTKGHLKPSQRIKGIPLFTEEDVTAFLENRMEHTKGILATWQERLGRLSAAK